MYPGWGDTAHALLMWRTIGVGTPHNIERTGQPSNYSFLSRLTSIWSQAKFKFQVGPECGNKACFAQDGRDMAKPGITMCTVLVDCFRSSEQI